MQCTYHKFFVFFFFFQAEDGIRDLTVTGVQTCALPILLLIARASMRFATLAHAISSTSPTIAIAIAPRSEERRVGKECRSRGSAYHEKKKKIEKDEGRWTADNSEQALRRGRDTAG